MTRPISHAEIGRTYVLEVEIGRVKGDKVKVRVSLARIDQLTKAGAAKTGDAQSTGAANDSGAARA